MSKENSLITRLWVAGTATPAARQHSLVLLLGVVGWVLVFSAYPFDWELPEYATY